MIDAELAAAVQGLKDRQEIYDCMVRYCRGQDRLDPVLSSSAYHSNAVLDFGGFVGPLEGYVEWGHNLHRTLHNASMHSLCNHSCDIDGDTAHAETYFIFLDITKQGEREIRAGRYVDRLEKRDGRWGIAERMCLLDCDEPELGEQNRQIGTGTELYVSAGRGDHSDPSYMRPLKIDRKRFRKPPAA